MKELGRAETQAALTAWRPTLDTFEALYVQHSKSELVFLEEVAAALANDHEATDQLRELLAQA
jgi:hypothetical protein